MTLSKEQRQIIKRVHEFVKEKSKDFSPDDIFTNHILGVRNFAIILAKEYNVNEFVVIIAAYLHDIYHIMTHEHKVHEIKGSEFAKKYLKQFNLSEEDIELIGKCILNHRGSKKNKRYSIEEKIIASSDAMDHINRFDHMFERERKEIGERKALEWVGEKIQRSWGKIELERGRKLIEKKYLEARKFFNLD